MFRTAVCRAVPAYSLFMKQSAKKFTGFPTIFARSKAMGKAYRALPVAEKQALLAKAKATKAFKRNVKVNKLRAQRRQVRNLAAQLSKATKKKVTLEAYKAFVKKSPKSNLAALVNKWKKAHTAKKVAKK